MRYVTNNSDNFVFERPQDCSQRRASECPHASKTTVHIIKEEENILSAFHLYFWLISRFVPLGCEVQALLEKLMIFLQSGRCPCGYGCAMKFVTEAVFRWRGGTSSLIESFSRTMGNTGTKSEKAPLVPERDPEVVGMTMLFSKICKTRKNAPYVLTE